MENVVLVIHLILAVCLIGVVLLQRSEGGGLGMGGGGGGLVSARGVATALGKLTWIFAIAFIATSIVLTIIAARKSAGSTVLDTATTPAPATAPAPAQGTPAAGTIPAPATAPDTPKVPDATDLLPPGAGGTQPPEPTQPRAD